ncbi:ABC transporter substrate-binding protein [Ramlibacter tataouinensis]|uniref:ABC transporter substrate-binding protein n=1 Tax=Ramlibacter tataouinensis TaxID=94132 RepID=UPI0022F3A941|nr:ABC transporter substrate-binding protein [Ramlibacter tataouinensis]WBY01226.1 ABC transporter substrate-binding protein [Ramlibacter tataouinensis]
MTIDRRELLSAGAAGLGWLAAGFSASALAQASGHTLNIALFPEPNGVVAGLGSTGPAQTVIGNIYDGLLRFDEKLQPMPNLATEWTVSPDMKVYTFKLKKGVTFHDGKPFTADDVVFTADKLMRTLNPRVRVAMASVESVKALDPHTVEFRMAIPYAAFIQLFDSSTLPIAPKHLYGDDVTKPLSPNPVGTGPFKFKEWQRGSFIHLVRNEKYHESGLPKLENVYWHIIPDGASRAAAFESGKVDVLPGGMVEFFDVGRLDKLPNTDVTLKGHEKLCPMAWMWMNHRLPLFQDLKVRKAVMHALNRDAMAKVVWQGFAKPSTGAFSHQTQFYTPQVPQYPFDTARARKLLAESSYKGQAVRLLPLPFGESWMRLAELIRQNLTAAGFKVDLQSADLPGTIQRQSGWDFDLTLTYMFQLGDPALGVARNYVSSEIRKGSPFNNVGGYQNPKVDALFERGSREIDPKKRAEIYADIQRTLSEDVAAAWLLDLGFPTVYRSKVDNLINTSLGLIDSLGRASIKSV